MDSVKLARSAPTPRPRARCLAPNAPVVKLSDVKKLIKERAAAATAAGAE